MNSSWHQINKIAELAIKWDALRRVAIGARKDRITARKEIGECEIKSGNDAACYTGLREKGDWCGVCDTIQPLHEKYIRATAKASAALRALRKEIKTRGES